MMFVSLKQQRETKNKVMKTYNDYKNENEAGEYIEDLFVTSVAKLEEFGHGWDFQGKYYPDEKIKIMITNRKGKLEAWWMDDFDSSPLDLDIALETVKGMQLY